MPNAWPALSYDAWSETCDTLHAHTQVLGKLEVELAPPEPQLQHAALRLSARGWETHVLPAPDGSGAFVAGLDLHGHEAFVEHGDGREVRIALTPNRPVAEVTREVLEAVGRLAGPVEINPTPQEVPWKVPLDEDHEHASYDADRVASYFNAASRAALVLAEFRAPFRGRSTPVNAWWGTFDLAVHLLLGTAGRASVGRLHHAQRRGCAAGLNRLVARRSQPRSGRLLRARVPGARCIWRREHEPGGGALGRANG